MTQMIVIFRSSSSEKGSISSDFIDGWSILKLRSGMGAYGGTARRRVHLATVLLRPPSAHRPGKRQARHARFLQIGLDLTQP